MRDRLVVFGPEQPADAVGSLAPERVGWIGVDARRGHLGVPQDALYHVDVYMQFAEQRSGGVARVVQPHVLDPGFAENLLPFLPIDVRVDRVAVWLAPDKIPVLPGIASGVALGLLRFEVLAQRRDYLSGQRNGSRPLASF